MTSFRTLCGAVAGVALCAAAPAVAADNWPTRSIQVISPFSAGNANDIVARVVLDEVSRQIGQSFVIENRPGGGGSLGAAAVAKADPDGYTVLLYSSSLSGQSTKFQNSRSCRHSWFAIRCPRWSSICRPS